MAATQCVKIISLPQGESLKGKMNHAVTLNSSGQVIMTDGTGEIIYGTVASDPGVDTVGEIVSIAQVNGSGVLKVVANAAITQGHLVVPTTTDGKVAGVNGIAGLSAEQQAMGVALEAATAADQVIEVLCHPVGPPTS